MPSFFTVDEHRHTVTPHLQAALTEATELLYRHPGPPIPINLKEHGLGRQVWITCSAASKTEATTEGGP